MDNQKNRFCCERPDNMHYTRRHNVRNDTIGYIFPRHRHVPFHRDAAASLPRNHQVHLLGLIDSDAPPSLDSLVRLLRYTLSNLVSSGTADGMLALGQASQAEGLEMKLYMQRRSLHSIITEAVQVGLGTDSGFALHQSGEKYFFVVGASGQTNPFMRYELHNLAQVCLTNTK